MMVSDVNGKKAITNYKTIKVFQRQDVPKISLEDGILKVVNKINSN